MFKTSQKGFAPIILLFVVTLIAVAAGAYLYGKGGLKLPTKQPTPSGAQVSATPTPTPDETANWKTYANKNLGFSIKYPDRVEVKPSQEAGVNVGPIQTSDHPFLFIQIRVKALGGNTLKQIANKAVQHNQWAGFVKPLSTININGLNGYSFTRNGETHDIIAFFQKDDNQYFEIFGMPSSNKDEKTIEDIISTFTPTN